ncbi:hypothetical protein CAAN1_10S00408 [[Candida] anglica]|uniref:RlpA-like protein double-psi beta-barrel domain-containing protein n=1 Tax=[Candida] anglica TaxID=148631 RepID=A0ABP0EE58_9ASCO
MKFAYVLALAGVACAVPVPAIKMVYVTTYTTVMHTVINGVETDVPVPPTSTAAPPVVAEVKPATTTSSPTTTEAPATTTEAPATTAPTTTVSPTTTSLSSSASTSTSAPAPTTTGGSSSGEFTGDGTYYDTGMGACGGVNHDTDYIVAISHLLFEPKTPNGNPNNNPLCGKKIRAFRDGKSVDVTVVDQCMGCKRDDLDFSPAAFEAIGDKALGRMDISWEWL